MKAFRVREILLGLVLLFGVGACTWSGVSANDTVARRIYVSATLAPVRAARVAATVAPFLGEPLSDVNMQAMAHALKQLPWLMHISVDRHWPDGVVIRADAHAPLALWGDDALLTADFTVITPNWDRMQQALALAELPQLAGPADTGKRVYMRFTHMNQRLASVSNAHIVRLQLDARGSWRATLANGLVLRFGREHLATRLQRFIDYALDEARTALTSAGYVDLRYSDGFAVGGTRTAAVQENGNEQEA